MRLKMAALSTSPCRMENSKRRVWREAKPMTRDEVIVKAANCRAGCVRRLVVRIATNRQAQSALRFYTTRKNGVRTGNTP